jgi:exonuclease VII small subunit
VTQPDSPTGVQVAPGDPGALLHAAGWHDNLADGLSGHSAMITDAATSVAPAWNGEAAASYQALSSLVSTHFSTAAAASRSAAASLRRYGNELDRIQREGMQALHHAEHWLDQVHTWTTRLNDANTAVTTAQGEVNAAQTQLNTAVSMDAKGVALAASASARLRTAQDALDKAKDDQRKAQHELTDAQHQLTHWQQRGARLWTDARDAAMTATGELTPLAVPAPPMAGPAPGSNIFTDGLLPATPPEWALTGLGGWSGYKGKWADKTVDDLEHQQRLNRSKIARDRMIADDPDASEPARASALSDLDHLGEDQRTLSSAIGDASRLGNYADHFAGPAGGLIDAGSHIAEGQSVPKAAAEGLASTIGGYGGAAGGAAACDATGVLAPISPLCAGAGGAIGGWAADKLAGLVSDL